MRLRPTILVAAFAACLLFPSAATAADWSLEVYKKMAARSSWEGFGVGTMIHIVRDTETSMPNMPQVPGMGAQTSEEKKTLVKITETEYVIKVESKQAGGPWTTSEEREPKTKNVTFEVKEVGSENVTVGGTSYPCKKIAGKKIEDGRTDNATFWENAEHGVLKMIMPGQRPGQVFTMTVTKLSEQRKVGDVTLACRTFSLSGQGVTGEMVSSLELPDATVRMVMNMSPGGGVKMKMTSDLKAFVKK